MLCFYISLSLYFFLQNSWLRDFVIQAVSLLVSVHCDFYELKHPMNMRGFFFSKKTSFQIYNLKWSFNLYYKFDLKATCLLICSSTFTMRLCGAYQRKQPVCLLAKSCTCRSQWHALGICIREKEVKVVCV